MICTILAENNCQKFFIAFEFEIWYLTVRSFCFVFSIKFIYIMNLRKFIVRLAFCKSMNYLVIMKPKQKFIFRFVYSSGQHPHYPRSCSLESSVSVACTPEISIGFSPQWNLLLKCQKYFMIFCLWSLIYSYHSTSSYTCK